MASTGGSIESRAGVPGTFASRPATARQHDWESSYHVLKCYLHRSKFAAVVALAPLLKVLCLSI